MGCSPLILYGVGSIASCELQGGIRGIDASVRVGDAVHSGHTLYFGSLSGGFSQGQSQYGG